MSLAELLKRETIERAEILETLRRAAEIRDEAAQAKADADRTIAELTAVARARDLVPMQDMTEALGMGRETVYWLQREHDCTQADLRKLERKKRRAS